MSEGFAKMHSRILSSSKKGRSRSGETATTASPFPSMEIPIDVTFDKRERRPRRGISHQFSTFSLLSMPSLKRGISQALDNPHLWNYDRDVYSSYDVNLEMKEDKLETEQVEESEESEDPFFAENPLPDKNSSAHDSMNSSWDSWGPSTTSVVDLPAGNFPALATPDVTRALIKKYISEIWNRYDLSYIPEVCSPKIRFNGASGELCKTGHEGLATMVHHIHNVLEDYHCEIHSMVCENGKAFCRLRFTGKQVGELLGFQPTYQFVEWMGATEFTCVDGLIAKVWELSDLPDLEKQLKAHTRRMQREYQAPLRFC